MGQLPPQPAPWSQRAAGVTGAPCLPVHSLWPKRKDLCVVLSKGTWRGISDMLRTQVPCRRVSMFFWAWGILLAHSLLDRSPVLSLHGHWGPTMDFCPWPHLRPPPWRQPMMDVPMPPGTSSWGRSRTCRSPISWASWVCCLAASALTGFHLL